MAELLFEHEADYIYENSILQDGPYSFYSIKHFKRNLYYEYTIFAVDEDDHLLIGIMSNATRRSNSWESEGNERLFGDLDGYGLIFHKTFTK